MEAEPEPEGVALMPLDRSDRPWTPVHTGAKNRVRLNWQARTSGRRTEKLDGIAVNPHHRWGHWPTTEADVLAMLRAGVPADQIASILEEDR